jgi:hypothetical protein
MEHSDIAKVIVEVSGSGIDSELKTELKKDGIKWDGELHNIPAGKDRLFIAKAFNSEQREIFEGRAEQVEILAGKTAAVMIVLQPKDPPRPYHNAVPVIDSLVASSVIVEPNENIHLRVSAYDPDPEDILTYAWTAQDGNFDRKDLANVYWIAPLQNGLYRLTITVSDNKGASLAVSVHIEVRAEERGSANITVNFNTWPNVSSVYAYPGRVDRGGMIALSVFASDLDGDKLTYQWRDSGGECTGNFSDSKRPDPVWTAPLSLPKDQRCTLSVEVYDGKGGIGRGTIIVQVAPPLQFESLDDQKPPFTTIDPPSGLQFNYILHVSLTCEDDKTGCKRIVYTLDDSLPSFDPPNGIIIEGSQANIELFTLNPYQTFRVRYASEDHAGNREKPKEAFYISAQ